MSYHQAMAGTPTDAGSGIELLRGFGRNMMDAVSAVPGLWWTVGESDPDSNVTRILVAAAQRGLNQLGAKLPEDGVFGTRTRQYLQRMTRGKSYLKWRWWEIFEELARGESMEELHGLGAAEGSAPHEEARPQDVGELLAYAKAGLAASQKLKAAAPSTAQLSWTKAVFWYGDGVTLLSSASPQTAAAVVSITKGDQWAKTAKGTKPPTGSPPYTPPYVPPMPEKPALLTAGFGGGGLLPLLLGLGAGFLLLSGGKQKRTARSRRRR